MARRRHTPEQIITKLREAEVALAQGQTVAQVCEGLEVTVQMYFRWRKAISSLHGALVQRPRRLKAAIARLRCEVSDLTLSTQS